MSAVNSTAPATTGKPAKPADDFPLFAHATKRWAKKIDGKIIYFGPWDDPQAALANYRAYMIGCQNRVSNGCQDRVSGDGKPARPYPDFPLFAHASGRWAKKIRGRTVYFGKWAEPDAALQKYLDQKDDLHAGRTPRAETAALVVKDLVNAFLADKTTLVTTGELTPRSWDEYKAAGDMLVEQFGKRRLITDIGPDDFSKLRAEMSSRWGLHRIAKNIQYTRSIFKYGFDAGLIERPVRFGPGFKRPSKKSFRIAKAEKGENIFTADELRKLIDGATVPMRAMLLLAINAGYGNDDCASLPIKALDLEGGWLRFARPKTGIDRKAPLWPETVTALQDWLDVRRTPTDPANADLVFVTAKGNSWHKETSDNPVSKEMAKLQKALGINGGRTFYSIRHTHRTIADRSRDQRACAVIMGHCDPSIAGHYVENVEDDRLQNVVQHVRAWLFPAPAETPRLKIADEPEGGAA